jgi:hypothetical protein
MPSTMIRSRILTLVWLVVQMLVLGLIAAMFILAQEAAAL